MSCSALWLRTLGGGSEAATLPRRLAKMLMNGSEALGSDNI